jgi:hypothetical protein
MNIDFDAALRRQGWNTNPRSIRYIPSSTVAVVNAARAIAVSAYPRPEHLTRGGKAERYSAALIAYMFRISKLVGKLDRLPEWVSDFKAESMQRNLDTGLRNLSRAFVVRDLIHSAENMQSQLEKQKRGEKVTFTMNYKRDLSGFELEMPLMKVAEGYVLSGKIPETKLASLRAAILYHRPALQRFEGPGTKSEERDQNYDYQNTYNRYVRPALSVQHIVQVVWEVAIKYSKEASHRKLPIDQILMRKAEWADKIHIKTAAKAPGAVYGMKSLGIPSCWCALTHFAEPLSDS